jgi:hypothetical protein
MMLPRATLWIKVRPEGSGSNSNRSAIGARVLVRYAGKVPAQLGHESVQLFICKRSASALRPGNGAKVSVEVHWPLAHLKVSWLDQPISLSPSAKARESSKDGSSGRPCLAMRFKLNLIHRVLRRISVARHDIHFNVFALLVFHLEGTTTGRDNLHF